MRRHPAMLRGDVAIVTGASRGLGAAVAHALAEAGATVALVARESPELALVTRRITEAGWLAGSFPADLRDPATADLIARDVRDRFGPVSILVNNVGNQILKPFVELTVSEFAEAITVNLVTAFAFCRALVPQMAEQREGLIVNIASDLAYRSMARGAAYCSSKRGLVALSEVLEIEHRADGIRVTTIQPGWISTGAAAEARQQRGDMAPEQVAAIIRWVCEQDPRVRIDTLTIHPMVQD